MRSQPLSREFFVLPRFLAPFPKLRRPDAQRGGFLRQRWDAVRVPDGLGEPALFRNGDPGFNVEGRQSSRLRRRRVHRRAPRRRPAAPGCTDVRSRRHQAARTSGISGSPEAENLQLDLQDKDACTRAVERRRRSSTTSPPTWAAWASSRTTRRCACSAC